MRIIDYTPTTQITNVENLPKCKGAMFLVAIQGPDNQSYIAKQWKRKLPKTLESHETLIKFGQSLAR